MTMRIFGVVLATVILGLVPPARAQQSEKVFRIGYLTLSPKPTAREAVLVKALRELGWIDGQNIVIEFRRANEKPEALAALAQELVASRVDIIVAAATPAVAAAKNATQTIPIVMVNTADAVASGFVASLAHPGGNITGNTGIFPELAGKRLELLKEVLPKLSRVSFLAYEPDAAHKLFVRHAQDAAQAAKITLQPVVIKNVKEISYAFQSMAKARAGAAIIQTIFPSVLRQGSQIAALGIKHRLPTISDGAEFAEQGGMMFYGSDPLEPFLRTAAFIDKILKGRKPADLPVEQPRSFPLIINLNTANQIGVTIPQWTLMKADRVIR